MKLYETHLQHLSCTYSRGKYMYNSYVDNFLVNLKYMSNGTRALKAVTAA